MSEDNYFITRNEVLRCEICDMTYHIGGHEYFGISVFANDKFICADCYYKLRVVIKDEY